MAIDPALFAEARELFESNRFIDAHRAVAGYQTGPQWRHTADPRELIWAARLAGRLGGNRLRRVLTRTAADRFPDHPEAIVESRWLLGRNRPVISILKESLARPELGSGDVELDSHWLIDSAFFWAHVRDFPRAHRLLDQAGELTSPSAWFHAVRAHTLLCEDRWDEAATPARLAWQTSPNKPAAAGYLVRVLLWLNRFDEAIESLSIAKTGQSYETLQLLAWVLCAKAERSSPQTRLDLAAKAGEICRRLEELSPLRDRFTEQGFAACRFDIAMLAEDPQAMQAQADKLKIPLYRQVSDNLRANPSGARAILKYNAVFQKQDRCLPTSIASIAGTFGHTLDADSLAKELTYNGTPIWRAMTWLGENGYTSKVFILTRELCSSLLLQGTPFVYTFSTSLDNSHATAAVGIDEGAGILLYHDPANERFGRVLLERLGEAEQPLGPLGLAFAPKGREAILDCIPDADARLGRLCQDFWQAVARKDTEPLAKLVAAMAELKADSPVTAAFRAYWQMLTDQLPAGIATLEQLCASYPKSIELQRMLLYGLNRTRNTARIREFLAQLVRRGRLPGVSDVLPWTYPPASCVSRYADLESLTAEGALSARDTLMRLLSREPSSSLAYHTLGDVYMRQGETENASLPYRLASLLGHTEEHFARSVFDSARMLGRQDEGLAYLRGRVTRLGALVEGGPPWATLIEALEDCGEADTAIATADEALAVRPDDAEVLVFLTRFWIRVGKWETAGELLERLNKCGSRPHYLGAAVFYFRCCGQWERALELCQEWAATATDNVEAYRTLASLMRNRQTAHEVAAAAKEWASRHVDDEDFEFIYLEQLRAAFQDDRQEEFVRARLKRNPQDTWAWRELGHLLVGRLECMEPDKRGPLLKETQAAADQAVRLAPREAATLYLQARLAEVNGQWKQAIDLLLEGLRIDPQYGWAYEHAWGISAGLSSAEQEEVLSRLEERLLLSVGPLRQARPLAVGIASRMGVDFAKARVQRWMARRPGDPELAEAHADVLLEHGFGKTDATQAAAELEEALRRHPQHYDLRMSLSYAYGMMLQDDRKREILQQGLKSWPLDSRVRVALAMDQYTQGQSGQALETLREGIKVNPQDSACRLQLARVQQESGDLPAAVQTLREALGILPEDVGLRRQLAICLTNMNSTPAALDVVREGLALYPKSTVFWCMLAEAMMNSKTAYDITEAEAALRKSLEFNYAYWDAVDLLAWLLASQYRFDEARAVVENVIKTMANPSPAQGRLAWIAWVSGQKRPAVDQLAQVLHEHPEYRWGWQMLIGWLAELDDADLTRRLLDYVPQAVRVDPEITVRRLDLLEKAKLSRDKLDRLWEETLNDFPRNENLLVRRFSMLAEQKEWSKAEEVLKQALKYWGQSPYVLACKVRLAVERRDEAKAIDTAMEVFQYHEDQGPYLQVWASLDKANLFLRVAERMVARIAQGEGVNVVSLCIMIDNYPPQGAIRVAGGSLGPINVLRWLSEQLPRCPWDNNRMALGAVIERLDGCGQLGRQYANKFRRKHKEMCRTHARLWQAIGHFLVTSPSPGAAVKWIADWRQRQGVEMIAVSYYLIGLGRRPMFDFLGLGEKWWRHLYETCRDALDRLGEDKTLLMHVAAMCEALLALGNTEEFIKQVGRYRALLETQSDRYWLPDSYLRDHTTKRLCTMADLLACQDQGQAVSLFIGLCERPRQHTVYPAAFKHMAARLGRLKTFAIAHGLYRPRTRPPKLP